MGKVVRVVFKETPFFTVLRFVRVLSKSGIFLKKNI